MFSTQVKIREGAIDEKSAIALLPVPVHCYYQDSVIYNLTMSVSQEVGWQKKKGK
jgi:hypothetical protein